MIRRTSFSRALAAVLLMTGVAGAAGPLPVAPPPREAKPKIDPKLLVGQWQVVHQNFRGIAPGEVSTVEYAEGGRYRFESQSPVEPPWSQDGAYAAEGDALVLQSDVAGPGAKRTRTLTIESLTPDRLVVFINSQRSVYARAPAK